MPRRADLPAHQNVHAAGAAQVQVIDGLDLTAHPLDPGVGLVFPSVILLENDDFQGGLSGDVPEEGHRLLGAVAVHVHQLNGLAVFPAQGSNVFGIAFLLVDFGLQIHIGL